MEHQNNILGLMQLVEKRLDEKTDSIKELLTNSIDSLRELNESRSAIIEKKFESLEKKLCSYIESQEDLKVARDRDNRISKMTLVLTICGWLISIASAIFIKFFFN